MKNTAFSFNYNGTKIPVVDHDNTYYVPITPICELLEVDYQKQLNFLRQNDLCTNRITTLVVEDGNKPGFRAMVCLPLMLAVGWIPNIKSNRLGFDQELIAFLESFFAFTKQIEQMKPTYWWN